MNKLKILIIVALATIFIMLATIPVKAGVTYHPGLLALDGPGGLIACHCDFWPPYCACAIHGPG